MLVNWSREQRQLREINWSSCGRMAHYCLFVCVHVFMIIIHVELL